MTFILCTILNHYSFCLNNFNGVWWSKLSILVKTILLWIGRSLFHVARRWKVRLQKSLHCRTFFWCFQFYRRNRRKENFLVLQHFHFWILKRRKIFHQYFCFVSDDINSIWFSSDLYFYFKSICTFCWKVWHFEDLVRDPHHPLTNDYKLWSSGVPWTWWSGW